MEGFVLPVFLLEFCKLTFNSRLVNVGEFRDAITTTRQYTSVSNLT